MSPGGGKTRSTTFNIMNRHETSFKMSLVQYLLQSTNSLMPYSGYMTLTLITLKTSQSSMDGFLNSFDRAESQMNKSDSCTTKELCPHGSGATSPCLTHCLPLSVSGSREPQTSTQWQTSIEKWTRVGRNKELNV